MTNGTTISIREYAFHQVVKNPGKEVKILSERALCEIFKVSRPTVRKALDELVKEGMLVIHPGNGTFTNPNYCKGDFSPGSKLSLGIIVGSGKNVTYDGFHLDIMSEAGRYFCKDFGRVRFVQTVNDDNKKTVEELKLLNFDALLWIHPTENREAVMWELQKSGLPTMCVNRIPHDKSLNFVSTDHYAAGKNAAEYLIKRGHEKSLFIGDSSANSYQDFLAGWLAGFSNLKHEFDERLLINDHRQIVDDINDLFRFKIDFTGCCVIGSEIWAAEKALKNNCGNNFLERYKLLGYKVAVENYLKCAYLNIDPVRLGNKAAEALFALAQGTLKEPVNIKICPEIIEPGCEPQR